VAGVVAGRDALASGRCRSLTPASESSSRIGFVERRVVLDPGVLEELLVFWRDHGLLPAIAGERPDRLTCSQTVMTRYSVSR
jgi:hypothetical protein